MLGAEHGSAASNIPAEWLNSYAESPYELLNYGGRRPAGAVGPHENLGVGARRQDQIIGATRRQCGHCAAVKAIRWIQKADDRTGVQDYERHSSRNSCR